MNEEVELFELFAQFSAFVEQAVLMRFEVLQGVLLGRDVVGQVLLDGKVAALEGVSGAE